MINVLFFQEIPLELAFIWSLNHERKSLVLTDHDPNLGRYAKMDPDQLRRKLEALREEEEGAVSAVLERGEVARVIMERALREMARRSKGESL